MASPEAVRAALIQSLEADLIGPFDPARSAVEVLEIPPSRWYLTGFLAPRGDREIEDPTAEDDLGAGADDEEESEPAPEPEPKQKNAFPASLGMSVFLPPAVEADTIEVTVSFAEYTCGVDAKGDKTWRRHEASPRVARLPLDSTALRRGSGLPNAPGVRVYGELEDADAPGLPPNTRALSIFVVNEREPGGRGRADESFLFQVEMSLYYPRGFVARPNRRGEGSGDPDEETADLQFRTHAEWAVGHGVAVVGHEGSGPVTRLHTTWIPRSEVRRVETQDEPGVTTDMDALSALSPSELVEQLLPLTEAYEAWIQAQGAVELDSKPRELRRASLQHAATRASERIRAGVELLRTDAEVREAFQLMNRAMASAARQRSPGRYPPGKNPSWRLFQLAFVLLNLPGVANDTHADRDWVELIYFPTGGGKTEAYLGVIGFTLLLRRLRGQGRPDKGLGVAVLLRYTLRLLTLDQLGRAATLICALELLRQERPERLGRVRYSVGLWVGRSATANTMDQVKKQVLDYKNSVARASPFPLTNCPWCGGPLGPDSLVLGPKRTSPEEVVVSCVSPSGSPPSACAFSPRKNREGLPVVFVDEQLYRELPSFIVATVDKFAMLPWRGETGLLFGRVSAFDGKQCFGPMDRAPKGAALLPTGFRPPELIVQDELHLISGPLGTMVGLYETAIEWLSCRSEGGATIRPKIIASTATVRNAQRQIGALFGRPMSVFPPPGVDAFDTYFARLDRTSPGRLYVGVAAPGRPVKAILLRTYVALLAAGAKQRGLQGDEAADAYLTLTGYFNSLRELGGMRRLVEDDVRARCKDIEERVPLGLERDHPWGAARSLGSPVELTSREKATAIKEAKDRLSKPHTDKAHVDVLLASNMISVGVDIDRLGLMVIAGQPKTTSEYIQASSRVGRQYPGLVVTAFNVRRPRDRSHYERFHDYHQTFYRQVEATSVTPFSGPALERGLTGTLLAMARLGDGRLTPPAAAMEIEQHYKLVEACVDAIVRRGVGFNADHADDAERLRQVLRERGMKIVESWIKLVRVARDEAAAKRSYSKLDVDRSAGKALLFSAVDDIPADPDEARFMAPTSMRDVEASVHLWVERGRALGGRR